MRRRRPAPVLALAAGLLLPLAAAACGGGDDDVSDVEAALLDDPTPQECVDALEAVLNRIEIPDDVDLTDGVDEEEAASAEEAVNDAAEGYFDPDDGDHPCNAALEELPAEELEDFMNGIDPEVLAFLGAQAQSEFEEIPMDDSSGG